MPRQHSAPMLIGRQGGAPEGFCRSRPAPKAGKSKVSAASRSPRLSPQIPIVQFPRTRREQFDEILDGVD